MKSELFSTLTISGPDAYKFLQGQITANLEDLNITNHKYLLSCYCNQKGRVISVFYISKSPSLLANHYDLLFLGDTATIFLTKIKKYSLFSKITFSEIAYLDISNALLSNNDLNINNLITHKIPIITKQTSEMFLPDNINLINLNAVSFKKGCFLGQEIIARVYYKGKTKQKLYFFTHNKTINYLPGSELIVIDNLNNKQIAGHLLFSNDNIGYAVIEERFITNDLFLDNDTENKIKIST